MRLAYKDEDIWPVGGSGRIRATGRVDRRNLLSPTNRVRVAASSSLTRSILLKTETRRNLYRLSTFASDCRCSSDRSSLSDSARSPRTVTFAQLYVECHVACVRTFDDAVSRAKMPGRLDSSRDRRCDVVTITGTFEIVASSRCIRVKLAFSPRLSRRFLRRIGTLSLNDVNEDASHRSPYLPPPEADLSFRSRGRFRRFRAADSAVSTGRVHFSN